MVEVWDAAAGITDLAGGARWLEGPAWVDGALLVSDIPNDRVLRYAGGDGFEVAVAGVDFSNGRTVTASGRVIQCSHGRRAVEELLPDGTTRPLVDRYGAVRLNSPNDVVVGPDGALWFTDPAYGIEVPEEGHPGVREYGACHVFRFDPDDGSLAPVVTDLVAPNGLAFSPDGATLYVTDTGPDQPGVPDGQGRIHAYPVAGSRVGEGRLFFTTRRGFADGLRVDADGAVWTSHGAGVTVLSAEGQELAHLDFPARVANLCFGGPDRRDVYVAATDRLHRLRAAVPGDAPRVLRG